VLHPVSLRNQKAILSLTSNVPNLYRAPGEIRNVEASTNFGD
jgi:hypothetical protein